MSTTTPESDASPRGLVRALSSGAGRSAGASSLSYLSNRDRRDSDGYYNDLKSSTPGSARRHNSANSNIGGGSGGGGGGQSASELAAAEAEAKRRKVQRACDVCRRKKIRCEGPMNSNSASKCANCQEYGLECTYVEAAKRRGPPKGYLETLEQRCGRMERLLGQLFPGVDISATVGPPPDRDDFDLGAYHDNLRSMGIPTYPALKPFPHAPPGEAGGALANSTPPAPGAPSSSSPRVLGPAPWKTYEQDPNRPPDDEEEAREQAKLAKAMVQLSVRGDPGGFRFHGKASGAHLVRVVNELKYAEADVTFLDRLSAVKRSEYWMVPEWEKVIATENVHPVDLEIWPDDALAEKLIDGYFQHVNMHMPLLNRVIFTRQYMSGIWRANAEFSKVCLMVFANGARFVDDERVYWPVDIATTEEGAERLRTDQDGTLKYSAGWRYLRALIKMGKSWLQGPSLLDLQTQVLICLFFIGSAVPHLAWLVSGAGLRMAQEIGIHVRSTMVHTNPIDRAMYNRAFWCLYHIDRINCAGIGRSVGLQDTDFDADYPIAVDDEYWDTGDPERDFKQPPGVMPRIAAFTHMLKLDHVLGAALRTIYAVNKLPEHGADQGAQRAVVVELDSALNAWADSVPDDLRWDPTRADQRLFEHSALLYAHYYYVQILIHRPFIPTRRNPESSGFPSLAICSNAARSICNILDAVLRRGRQSGVLPGQAVNIAFALPASTAAIVLLMNVYAVRQQQQDRERCMNDVKRVIAALKEMELTWRQAGKMTDMISEVARESTSDLQPPTPSDAAALHALAMRQASKRSHDLVESEADVDSKPSPMPSLTRGPSMNSAATAIHAPAVVSPPSPPYTWSQWGTGLTPTGEIVMNPELFENPSTFGEPINATAGVGADINYAMANFDLLGDASSSDFWAQLFGPQANTLTATAGVNGMGTSMAMASVGVPSPGPGPGPQQPTWNFMPWLPPEQH